MRDLIIVSMVVALVFACMSTGNSAVLTVIEPAVPVDHGINEPIVTWISPDGNRVLTGAGEIYVQTRNTDTGLWSVRTPLGIPHTTGIGDGYLSPDENWCYYNVANDPQLYRSQRTAGGWPGTWSTGTPVSGLSAHGNVYASFNGAQIYFNSTSLGSGPHDIYVADADTANPPNFLNLTPVAEINTTSGETWPWISSDGLLLLFGSDRPGGYGGMDLYYATRNDANGLWSAPINLGPNVNTAANEDVPRFAEQAGSLFFQRSDVQNGVHIMQATVVPEPSTLIIWLLLGTLPAIGVSWWRKWSAT